MLIQVSQDPPKALARAAMLFLGMALLDTLIMVIRLFMGHGLLFNLNILGFFVFGGLLAQKPGWRVFGIILASFTLVVSAVVGFFLLLNFTSPAATRAPSDLFVLLLLPVQFAAAVCQLYLLLRDDVTGWFEIVRLPPSAMPPVRPKASTNVPQATPRTPTGK